MFGIGDFARHGRVSVRMLRHYDKIGLLRPARVETDTGYRFYEAAQLARLNRIIALKDLGFTLQQVQTILDERVSVDELRGMLRLRQTELAAMIEADTARLAGVEARLESIEREDGIPPDDVVIKSIPPVRVAELTGIARSYAPEDIGPIIQPLYPELTGRLTRAGLPPAGPAIAYYENAPNDDAKIVVHAAIPVTAEPGAAHDFTIVDLPAIPSAATIVHRGPMADVMPTGQALAHWIEAHGHHSTGYARELYLAYCPTDTPDHWVTELQEPITPA